MALKSMTGYARAGAQAAGYLLEWEVKSVNAKGLDIRVRVPSDLDGFDLTAKKRIAAGLARGSVAAGLSLSRPDGGEGLLVDDAAFRQALTELRRLAATHKLEGPRLMDVLPLKGVMGAGQSRMTEDVREAVESAALPLLGRVLEDLVARRADEGAALAGVLSDQLAQIEDLVTEAAACEAAQSAAIRQRYQARFDDIMGEPGQLDPARLEQEAAHLAIKQDIREELDRLRAHIAAARDLMAAQTPVGRQLDFLAQEFHREANTLCSKAPDREITRIGLALKTQIDRMREQCQNVE